MAFWPAAGGGRPRHAHAELPRKRVSQARGEKKTHHGGAVAGRVERCRDVRVRHAVCALRAGGPGRGAEMHCVRLMNFQPYAACFCTSALEGLRRHFIRQPRPLDVGHGHPGVCNVIGAGQRATDRDGDRARPVRGTGLVRAGQRTKTDSSQDWPPGGACNHAEGAYVFEWAVPADSIRQAGPTATTGRQRSASTLWTTSDGFRPRGGRASGVATATTFDKAQDRGHDGPGRRREEGTTASAFCRPPPPAWVRACCGPGEGRRVQPPSSSRRFSQGSRG